MTTPTWLTGFEYGLATPSVNGAGLIDAITGGCTIVVPSGIYTPHSGSYVLRTAATAAVLAYISKNITAGQTFVTRFYLNQVSTSLPATDRIVFSITTVGHKIQLLWDASQASYSIGIDGVTTQLGTVTVRLNEWHCIDIKAVTSASPWLIDWQIDNVTQTQLSNVHAAENMSVIDYGLRTLGAQVLYYDDIVHSVTAADYPIGHGGTVGLRPDSDGANNPGVHIMEDQAGHDISVTYPAYSKVNEDPWVSTVGGNYVKQVAVGVGNYCEINFADMTPVPSIIGVEGLLEYAASGAAADEGACIIRDGATETTIWGSPAARADYSETTAFYKSAIVTAAAPPHTYTSVNGLKCRFGYSNNVTTVPYWLAIMLEVAYKIPDSSVLETNAAVMIEEKLTQDDIRQTNAAVMIEEKLTQDDIRMTNAAIMVEIVLDTVLFEQNQGPGWQMPP